MTRLSLLLGFPVLLILLLSGCQSNPNYADSGSQEVKLETEDYDNSPARIYIQLAQAYLAENDIETSLGYAQKAVISDSANPHAHNILALIYQRLGQLSKAEAGFRKALSYSPNNPYINNTYGAFLCESNQLDKSLIYFDKSASYPLYDEKWKPLTNAGICALRAKNLELAQEYLRKALQYNGKYRIALYNMIEVSVLQENYWSARAYLQRYLEVGKHNPSTLGWGIQTEQKLGDMDRLESYKLFLKANFPDSEQAKQYTDG